MCFVRDKVNVASFVVPFKGKFAGKFFNSPFSPKMEFPNSPICAQFEEFISSTIIDRVKNGSLVFWGRVGQVEAPHLVMPITVEPSKPRMCHDERFLNLWIKDCPFSLDYLSDLPRYVGSGHYQIVCDDKSGYDHICLSPSSRTLFGLKWKACYFVYNTLPFGWKASAYVYHTTGLLATSYIRTLGVPCSQYIDDRHAGQLMVRRDPNLPVWSDFELAEAAAYIVVSVLTSLGYTLALSKSSLIPSQRVRFLGYLCDSLLLAQDKKLKFKTLRESILSQDTVDLKTLQRFAGKTTSFSITVLAARLYTRASFRAISSCIKSPHKSIKVSGDLRREILYWRFLDNWQGCLPWFEERHVVMTMYSDASNSGWGGVFPDESGNSIEVLDYWTPSDRSQPIVIREALALKNAILAGAGSLAPSRVDAHVDSLPLVRAWSNQGGKSKALSNVIQAIYETFLRFNIALSLVYVPSGDNPADTPSRALSDSDCMLSPRVWREVQRCWGPRSIDLMALDSNAPRDSLGVRLRHFTPWPSVESAGVNILTQTLHPSDNAYVFPPLALVGVVLRFLSSQPCPFTFVTPDPHPRRYWWPIISGRSTDSVRLGALGDLDVLLFPTPNGSFLTKPLPWYLWAFRVCPNPCISV